MTTEELIAEAEAWLARKPKPTLTVQMVRELADALRRVNEERDTWMTSSASYGSDAVEWKIRAQAAESDLQAARTYIEVLESCQDGYYRATESDEARAYHASQVTEG